MTLDARFKVFDEQNPQVYAMFRSSVAEAAQAGARKIGAKMIMENIRWRSMIETRGEPWKVNNSYSSRYVRKLLAESPHLEYLFERRALKS